MRPEKLAPSKQGGELPFAPQGQKFAEQQVGEVLFRPQISSPVISKFRVSGNSSKHSLTMSPTSKVRSLHPLLSLAMSLISKARRLGGVNFTRQSVGQFVG